MCGRFVVDDVVWEEVEALVGQIDHSAIKNGDMYPSGQIFFLGAKQDGMTAPFAPHCACWGYPGFEKGKLLINARSETVRQRPVFRHDFEKRRCVIPARGFYEWNAKKEKFYFTGTDRVLYLAGIYKKEEKGDCVTVLTTRANASVEQVHDRMPLLIPGGLIARWVEETDWSAAFLKEEQPALKAEKESGGYEQLSLF